MELLYLCTYELNNPASLGVWKKMGAQRKVFAEHYDVSYTYMDRNHFYLKNDTQEIDLGELRFPGRIYCLMLLLNYYKKMKKVPDCMYVRYTMSDWNVIKLFKYLKKNGTRIIVEFPTYPYEDECKDNLFDYGSLLIDRVFRTSLYKCADYAASYGDIPTEIFGIRTIPIQNGVDSDSINMIHPLEHGNVINLIGVASLSKWHGYDRVLMGLNNYYSNGGQRTIHFNIVGEGSVLPEYKKFVADNELNDVVTFHGFKSGQELDDIYDLSDIAIGSLGSHRVGVYGVLSTLKSREYAVRGIPFITSNEIDILPSSENSFILVVSEDDSAVDINSVIDFFDRNQESPAQIRKIGIEKGSIFTTMKPVISAFKTKS